MVTLNQAFRFCNDDVYIRMDKAKYSFILQAYFVYSLLMFKNEQNFKKWINLEHSPKPAFPSPSMEGRGDEQLLNIQWMSKLTYKRNKSELMNASQVNVSWPGRDSTRSSAQLSLAYKQLTARKRGIPSSSWPLTLSQLKEAFQWRHNYLHVPKTAMGQKQRTRKWPKYTQIVKDQGCESKSPDSTVNYLL